jgi:hypothetical protein
MTVSQPLLHRPSFPLVLMLLAGIVITMLIALSPSPAGIWEELDPASFSRSYLRQTTLYTGPLRSDSDTLTDQPTRAWRTLMHRPQAAAEFRALAADAAPAGKLWALSALTLLDTLAAEAVFTVLRSDTSKVAFIQGCDDLVELRAMDLADLARYRTWALALRDAVPTCGLWRLKPTCIYESGRGTTSRFTCSRGQ